MFRRSWASLPKDASFPSTLEGLGYFVNDQDEVRSIANPDCYFKYFLNKNARVNDRQRFEFNGALARIVWERLEREGLQKVALPRHSPPNEPHVNILASPDLKDHARVIAILGEPTQDLGVLAGRVANGPGGIDKGSLVSVVRTLKKQQTSDSDATPPGIVLANMGQRYWWPEGCRALTLSESAAVPMASLVHAGRRHIAALNDIPGSESAGKHLETVFGEVLGGLVAGDAKIDVIAIGDSCEVLEKFLDDKENWKVWGERLGALALVGSLYAVENLTNDAFKTFLSKRACSFLQSGQPLTTPLAPPEGNQSLLIEPLGTPCFSSGEPFYIEMILIKALDFILEYLQGVATTPNFENPPIVVVDRPEAKTFTEEDWEKVPEVERPAISTVDPEAIVDAVTQERRWRKFGETGVAPDSDDEDSDEVKEVAENDGEKGWDKFWASLEE